MSFISEPGFSFVPAPKNMGEGTILVYTGFDEAAISAVRNHISGSVTAIRVSEFTPLSDKMTLIKKQIRSARAVFLCYSGSVGRAAEIKLYTLRIAPANVICGVYVDSTRDLDTLEDPMIRSSIKLLIIGSPNSTASLEEFISRFPNLQRVLCASLPGKDAKVVTRVLEDLAR